MLEIFKSKEQKQQFVSSYQNPFDSKKIKKIEFVIENSFWTSNETAYKSRIDFDSGKTTGSHRIEANSFNELVL